MATVCWTGGAVDVTQVDTLEITGAWSTGDKITIAIGDAKVVVTLGSTSASPLSAIATLLHEALTGATFTDSTADCNVLDSAGQSRVDEVPEFSEFTVTVSSETLTFRGNTPGKPFTFTVTDDSGTGTHTHNSGGTGSSVACTGKNWFDNADNWSGGSVPTNSDDVYFDGVDVDCLYGLSNASISPQSLTVTAGHTSNIGLGLNAGSYSEYRLQYLTFGGGTAMTVDIGTGESGSGPRRVNIDTGASSTTFSVYKTGTRLDTSVPPVLLKSTATTSDLQVIRGDVGYAFFDSDSGHIDTLTTGYESVLASDATVVCGTGTDLANATLKVIGGTVDVKSAGGTATVLVEGGTFRVHDGAWSSIKVGGRGSVNGKVEYFGAGTITTLIARKDGYVDFDKSMEAMTVTNCTLQSGASLCDNTKRCTFTNDIILDECGVQDVTLELGWDTTVSRVS